MVEQVRAQATVDLDETAVRAAAAPVMRLRVELDEAEVERSRREQRHRKAQADLAAANQAAKKAAQRLDDAVRGRER